ncbi:DnaJ domain-containing protein [Hypoxylon trugodes]|uniref:DnaJ domain-containing protein n=1 Tax=Hypoxylon trugodes TaxID=326681 RepID=UPI002190A23C|nr:DnaJ domain-containing protein [Hypoxylon trugodes]KAI1386668.1 DnaJ domain-containing protein [Hypoxylon trugodes]
MSDPYAILGVHRSANNADITSAFRQLSLRYHPDRKDVSAEANHDKFILLKEAYDILIDPNRRRNYDNQLPLQTNQGRGYSGPGTNYSNTQRGENTRQPHGMTKLKNLKEPFEVLWRNYQAFRYLPLENSAFWKANKISGPSHNSFSKLEHILLKTEDEWSTLESRIEFASLGPNGMVTSKTILMSEYSRLEKRIADMNQSISQILYTYDMLLSDSRIETEWERLLGLYLQWCRSGIEVLSL